MTVSALADRGPKADSGHVYVHVPFCRDRCTYCAFATSADRVDDHLPVVLALLKEAARVGASPAPSTLYFGGGTPALLETKLLDRLIQSFSPSKSVDHHAEITLECNPRNISRDSLVAWREIGINRLSMGVQTFDDSTLKSLARLHSGDEARRALELVALHWPNSWSADLLVGWAGQTSCDLESDLETLLESAPPHVSVYGLTVEPGTPLARLERQGRTVTVDDDQAASFDGTWRATLEDRGLGCYEVSNFSRHGHRSAHNQAYWMGLDYIGLGPGAGSSRGAWRWSNRRDTASWLRAVQEGRSTREHVERLDAEARLIELLGSGLRTRNGVSLAELDRRFSTAWRLLALHAAKPLVGRGLMVLEHDRLRIETSELGRADRILAALMNGWPSPESATLGSP